MEHPPYFYKLSTVMHVDVYRRLSTIMDVSADSSIWLDGWFECLKYKIDSEMNRTRRKPLTATSAPEGFYEKWPPCTTKVAGKGIYVKGYDRWLRAYEFDSDDVAHMRKEYRELEAEYYGDGESRDRKKERRMQLAEEAADKKRSAQEEFWRLRDTRCSCGRVAANEEAGKVWCIFCECPTEASHREEMPCAESVKKGYEERRPAAISDVVGWEQCEVVRARVRKHGGISREYLNTLLYLKRVKEDEWLETYDELEKWLEKSPRTFLSLPIYPSWRHGRDACERRLGRWVYYERRRDEYDYDNTVAQAKYYLLCCLDGWSTWIHDAGRRTAAVDFGGRGSSLQNASASSWTVKFEEAEAWISQNDTRPRAKSKDPQERALGKFLERNRTARREGKLDEGRDQCLQWIDKGDSHWDRSFDATAAWFTQHAGQTPKRTAKSADERNAAVFMKNQRARWKQKALSKVQRKRLAEAPWWRSSQGKSRAKAMRTAVSKAKKRALTKKAAPKMKRGRAGKHQGVRKSMKKSRK